MKTQEIPFDYIDNQLYINQLNLRVLRRLDNDILEIIGKCNFSSLHELDRATKVWHN